MNFASADYIAFLLAVFALDELFSALGSRRSPWLLVVIALLGDLLWLLLTRAPGALWDPVGALVYGLIADPATALPTLLHRVPQLVAGTALAAAAFTWGRRRGDTLDAPESQSTLGRAATVALAALGVSLLVAWRLHRVDAFGNALAAAGHPVWIVLISLAAGAAWQGGVSARSSARLLGLFATSALCYHVWAASTTGGYRFLLGLILATVVLDWYLGRWLDQAERPRQRRALLALSLVANLGVLVFFKYAGFFQQTAVSLLGRAGVRWEVEPLVLLLPAGISFHTFQSLSYTLDVYRKELRSTPSLLRFGTFVLFFPQLVAGPIVRAETFLPQMDADARPGLALPSSERDSAALLRIAVGMIKKVVLADQLAASLVDAVFAHPDRFSAVEVLVAVYGYAFQIYLDFSAYSDIAIGSAQLLGFTLPENFDLPYRARSLQDFWRRWHISLSTWLRDYLYIPLGGSRGSEARTRFNLAATMLLGGLWHGANWTFIAWGALHGAGLGVTRWAQRTEARDAAAMRLPRALSLVVAAAAMIGLASPRVTVPGGTLGAFLAGWALLTPAFALWTAWLSARAERADLRGRVAGFAAQGLTFHYVLVAWVFFRASSFDGAAAVFAQLATRTRDATAVTTPLLLALVAAALGHSLGDRAMPLVTRAWRRAPDLLRALAFGLLAYGVWQLAQPRPVAFIYFQF
jgi:alginate O-acetyltransferase complex protein AlgI